MEKASTNEGTLWGGRFKKEPSDALKAISKSTHFDFRLAKYDILGSIAHADALEKAEIITKEENAILKEAFTKLMKINESGDLIPSLEDEDLHGSLERILIEMVGNEVGGKIRAGRSRNDQIATIIRLYLRDEARLLLQETLNLVASLADQANDALQKLIIMPGRTHLQHAQPVLFSHYLLAHCHSIMRDVSRIRDWQKRVDYSPYGSGALAGQTLGLNQQSVAKSLGFVGVEPNSIDAVSSRDAVYEFAFVITSLMINLSKIAEEIIIFNTKEFNYVELDDAYSTGSSIMPQKKNPDIAELTRGKTGRFIGEFAGLLATCKALPLSYNRDLQEDKEPIFDMIDQLHLILPAFTGMIQTMKVNQENVEAQAIKGFALATDIAEWLVKKGVPFKVAHELSGKCVQYCEKKSYETKQDFDLYNLSAGEFSELFNSEHNISLDCNEIEQLIKNLTALGSVNMRDNYNGTSPQRVKEQLIGLIKKINDERMH